MLAIGFGDIDAGDVFGTLKEGVGIDLAKQRGAIFFEKEIDAAIV